MTQRRGLGRGLAALIPGDERTDDDGRPTAAASPLREIALDAIEPNARQPREIFDEDELDDLAASIREVGLLQPVVVRPAGPEGRYELVAGERRVRASRRAGLERIPALVRETSDNELLREAVIENIHRVQLNPLEEAAAFQQLLDDFGVTQEELAKRLGKSRPTITNSLRLLALPAGVQRKVAAGVLSAGHAKALLSLERREDQERLADRILAEGLSVRSTEEIVRIWNDEDAAGTGSSRRSTPSRRRLTAPGLQDLEERLSDALHTRVKVAMGARKGKLTIEFGSVGDLERVVGVIAQGLQTSITVQEGALHPQDREPSGGAASSGPGPASATGHPPAPSTETPGRPSDAPAVEVTPG